MTRGSTFPADDVPSRRDRILGFLGEHDPVPVPSTTLYLAVEDKRALADEFADLVAKGEIESLTLAPGTTGHKDAAALSGIGPSALTAPLAVYRLTEAGRATLR